MMNRKIFAVFLAFFILLMSTGCQLAREDMAENRSGDKLIGVFITKEYLDLFDIESYFNDNIHKISPGGSIAIDGDTKSMRDVYTPISSPVSIPTLKQEAHSTPGSLLLKGLKAFPIFAQRFRPQRKKAATLFQAPTRA